MNKAIKSIERASALLSHSGNQDDFIIIKLVPDPPSCCCFHCWPDTWRTLNDFISPFGQIEDEGDVLISHDGYEFVIECHETGPEIVIYLTLLVTIPPCLESIINILALFISSFKGSHRRNPARIKVVSKRFISGSIHEEILTEIDLPLSKDNSDIFNDLIRKNLQRITQQAHPDGPQRKRRGR